ncbi:MAG: fumarylacetoacetate hydrolase family protein [Streptosporangiaceae bacterium]
MTNGLWRVAMPGGSRLARGPVDSGPRELLAGDVTVGGLLAAGSPGLADLETLPAAGTVPSDVRRLPPLDDQPVWAAGVTFERSRAARMEESHGADIYERVYGAERPEIFFKAMPGASRGPDEEIGIRSDSTWDVPEPELGIVADASGRAVAYVVGNDLSSRSIEGENPLYLPQAKIWEGSCAVGPCLVPAAGAPPLDAMTIALAVRRAGEVVCSDRVELARMRRGVDDLLSWLFRAQRFPRGVVLLTGTSIVPDPDFTLREGDEVEITATGLGSLVNVVRPVEAV